MTHEASKSRAVRGVDFDQRYLSGRVIDIGCGPDPIVQHAERFDLDVGDAQEIAALRPAESYDAVCSSHCLEHMRDVPKALHQWWQLVRPGGHLVLVVPDEDLYEQGGWPSLFNADHKATFRLGGGSSWSPVSYELTTLVGRLPGAEIVSVERHDQGYRYDIRKDRISSLDRLLFHVDRARAALWRGVGMRESAMDRGTAAVFRALGTPVDQTLGSALAQLQIIVRKRP